MELVGAGRPSKIGRDADGHALADLGGDGERLVGGMHRGDLLLDVLRKGEDFLAVRSTWMTMFSLTAARQPSPA